jgi:hypothetical protein
LGITVPRPDKPRPTETARRGDTDRVTELLRADPRLLVARDPMGNTALILAVNGGHHARADILVD